MYLSLPTGYNFCLNHEKPHLVWTQTTLKEAYYMYFILQVLPELPQASPLWFFVNSREIWSAGTLPCGMKLTKTIDNCGKNTSQADHGSVTGWPLPGQWWTLSGRRLFLRSCGHRCWVPMESGLIKGSVWSGNAWRGWIVGVGVERSYGRMISSLLTILTFIG